MVRAPGKIGGTTMPRSNRDLPEHEDLFELNEPPEDEDEEPCEDDNEDEEEEEEQ
jgi:hypothetical protein